MKTQNHRFTFFATLLICLTAFAMAYGLQQTYAPGNGVQVLSTANQTVEYPAAALGVNALTLPASSTSADSNVIDTRGVKEMTLQSNCTQGFSLNINLFQDDGATKFTSEVAVVTAVGAGNQSAHWGSEQGVQNSTGTAGLVTTEMPQRAVSFSYTNGGATPGTCTARLFLQY